MRLLSRHRTAPGSFSRGAGVERRGRKRRRALWVVVAVVLVAAAVASGMTRSSYKPRATSVLPRAVVVGKGPGKRPGYSRRGGALDTQSGAAAGTAKPHVAAGLAATQRSAAEDPTAVHTADAAGAATGRGAGAAPALAAKEPIAAATELAAEQPAAAAEEPATAATELAAKKPAAPTEKPAAGAEGSAGADTSAALAGGATSANGWTTVAYADDGLRDGEEEPAARSDVPEAVIEATMAEAEEHVAAEALNNAARDAVMAKRSRATTQGAATGLDNTLRVFVYPLPKEFNVEALEELFSAEDEAKKWYSPLSPEQRLHEAILSSPYTTQEPEEADLYYVPFYSSAIHLMWNGRHVGYDAGQKRTMETLTKAVNFVRRRWPYWNRHHGADHVFTLTFDYGRCLTMNPGLADASGAHPLIENATVISIFGEQGHKCFDEKRDIVIPPYVNPNFAAREEFLDESSRTTLAYFRGRVEDYTLQKMQGDRHCYQGKLEPKNECGWIYSFGYRQRIYEVYSETEGFDLKQASSTNKKASDASLMLTSKFCLCPPGLASWSPRAVESMLYGCNPVFMGPGVLPFEKSFPWANFSIRITDDQLMELPTLLPVREKEGFPPRVEMMPLSRGLLYPPLKPLKQEFGPDPYPYGLFTPLMTALSDRAQQVSRSHKQLKIYVYEMPEELNEALWLDEPKCHTYMFRAEVFFYRRLLASPYVTTDPEEADFFYVPVYSMCHFKATQGLPLHEPAHTDIQRALRIIKQQEWWRRHQGRDHIFALPGDYGGCFTYQPAKARGIRLPELKQAILLQTLGEHGHPCYEQVRQAIVLPPTPHVKPAYVPRRSEIHATRPIRVHFRGTCSSQHGMRVPGYRLRKELVTMHMQQKGWKLTCVDVKKELMEGNVDYLEEMGQAEFCVVPRGYASWSSRMIEAVQVGCIPIVPVDNIVLPLEHTLPWRSFSVVIREQDIKSLPEIIAGYGERQVMEMQLALSVYREKLTFSEVSPKDGVADVFDLAIHSLWSLKERDPKYVSRDKRPLQATRRQTLRVVIVYGSTGTGKKRTGLALAKTLSSISGQQVRFVEFGALTPSYHWSHKVARKEHGLDKIFYSTIRREHLNRREFGTEEFVDEDLTRKFQLTALRLLLRDLARSEPYDDISVVIPSSALPLNDEGVFHGLQYRMRQELGIEVEFFKLGLSLDFVEHRRVLEKDHKRVNSTMVAYFRDQQLAYEVLYQQDYADLVVKQWVNLTDVRGQHPFLRVAALAGFTAAPPVPEAGHIPPSRANLILSCFSKVQSTAGQYRAEIVHVTAGPILEARSLEECAARCLSNAQCSSFNYFADDMLCSILLGPDGSFQGVASERTDWYRAKDMHSVEHLKPLQL